MTIAWILYVLLVGSLLALGAAAVASALQLAGRATRWVWALALVATAILAVAAPGVRSVDLAPVRAVSMSAPPGASVAATERGLWPAVNSARVLVASTAVRALAAIGARVPGAARWPVVAAWIAASAVLLALYVLVNARLTRARRRWPTQTLQGVTVRVAPAAGPAVIGMVRAEIVVPRSLLERSPEEQRLIVDHEQEHLRAGDHLMLAVACLAVIALPWHPAVWYVLARLRLAIELDCDARVLRRGAAPRSYGALLIDMAARGVGTRVGTLALADRPSHLERRLLAMRTTRSRFVSLRVGALGAGAALLVLAACEAKMPTAADIASMDVASAQKSAAEAGMVRTPYSDRTDFFVNGVKVSAEQARAMQAKQIGSIEVVKSELASGRDTIFVTTSDRMPSDREFRMATPDAKQRGEAGQTYVMRKQQLDSAEHTVAHVEGELATVRALGKGTAAPDRQLMRVRTPSGGGDPVFIIDDKQVSAEEFSAVKGEDIASISVYKGEQALKISSDLAAKNGVIVAKMKAAAKKQ